MTLRDDAATLLQRLTGRGDAEFREGQWEAIESLVEGRAKTLVVQRTGWGKSAVYFVATRLLRDAGAGPTLLISPLLALMRNQIEMAERAGVHAATINSGNRDEWDAIISRVRRGEVDILLISPERLNNLKFRDEVLGEVVDTVGLLVVDEAHCISDWGHDFRPDYRRIARIVEMLPKAVPVLCTTATANNRVVDDIVSQLGDDLHVIRGTLERESLSLSVLPLGDPAERLAWLADALPELPGSGIVYCLTIRDTDRVTRWLQSAGIDAVAYTGQSDDADRLVVEEKLKSNEVKAVVATSALGMGYDKPDLGFVVHYQSPGSPIAYYQQVGRAGRAVDTAHGVLLQGNEDVDIQDYFISVAFPSREKAEAVVELLADADSPVGISVLLREVNVGRSRLEAMLKVLEVDGAVERTAKGWVRTNEVWTYDEERVKSVTALRRAEQEQMREYARTDGCRMAFLRGLLDDPGAVECGRCDRCAGTSMAREVSRELVAEAVQHLRASSLVLEPRKQWPPSLPEPKGKIPPSLMVEEGRALSIAGDGGWGSVVRASRRTGRDLPDELVDAAARLMKAWHPKVSWVTAVPSSQRHAASLAERLAARLGLDYVPRLYDDRKRRPQSEMENSAQQLANVYGAFAIDGELPGGPVLLVDDVADSRWTLTAAGATLREAGVPAVVPFVAASGS